uniref:Cytochrome c oxidase subunit 2 n=1 Tax=Siphonodentalium lobatum TaxID=203167 RepID=Q6VEH4_9MOLL|nr:cytochrome c oxidase subunit II [Siphonodentalium lobatum]AAP91674.1 cytochrome c oxidase subunit II [Siphonodentalium lobatum]
MSNFQESAGGLFTNMIFLFDYMNAVMAGILMTVLITAVMLLMNKKTARYPFHNIDLLEITWTAAPAVILIFLAVPSLRLLYLLDEELSPTMSLKAIGHQWYWSYQTDTTEFDSYMVKEEDLLPGNMRLLEVDNRLFTPFGSTSRLVVTSADVIHAWTIPSMGIKADAVPGRLNQLNLFSDRPGVFYGQCSEICGANHSFMPIVLEMIK